MYPQIASGYTIQGTATAGGGIYPPVSPLASFAQQLGATLNVQGGYQDRPDHFLMRHKRHRSSF